MSMAGQYIYRPAIAVTCLVWVFVSCHAQQSPLRSDSLTAQQRELGSKLAKTTSLYLDQKIGLAGFGGKPFCGYKLLDVEESDIRVYEYVDVLCQEYYVKGNGKLEKGTAIALPVALTIAKAGTAFEVISHEEPRDGDEFAPDIKRIFPERVQPEIFNDLRSRWRDAIMQQITADAERYYANLKNRTR